jgi:hypothetical protein
MVLQLSNMTFTNWADVVPSSGADSILNSWSANTLAGNDTITGLGFGNRTRNSTNYGIYNSGTLNTAEGDDLVRGVYNPTRYFYSTYDGLLNDTGNIYLNNIVLGDDDSLILNNDDNVILPVYGYGIYNSSTIVTGEGDDIINGTNSAESQGLYHPMGFVGIYNNHWGTINTGNGADSLISDGKFTNFGEVLLGEGNDSITVNTNLSTWAIENYTIINAGDGNDTITSYGAIYNQGTISTSNGNDSIIADRGFQSGFRNRGNVFLGEGQDYIKGFGSGDFYGGSDNDTLELTSGNYTVGIWGTSTSFIKDNQVMLTYEFETLIAGGTIYDFASLNDGQIINF